MPKEQTLTGGKSKPAPGKPTAHKSNPAPTIKPNSKPELIESNQVNTKELVQTTKGVKLPAFLQQTQMPATSDRQQTGYVGFASTKSKNWMKQQAAGCTEGQPYLSHEGQIIPLKQLEYFLLRAVSYMSLMMGTEGKFVFVTDDMEMNSVTCNSTAEGGNTTLNLTPYVPDGGTVKLEPHYIGLLAVNVNGSYIPIKGDFRGTKSGGMELAIRAVEAAGTPEWGKLSESHKATLAFPQPWGRVYTIVTTTYGVSKSNGNPYFAAKGNALPATIDQMQSLANALQDDEFKGKLAEANTNYEARIAFMNKVMNEGPQE